MKLAAVIYEAGDAKAIDALLCEATATLKANGLSVAGTIQRNPLLGANACAHMVLEDIVSGRSFDISVPGDKKANVCSLDPAALEDVAGQVAATLEGSIDIVLINRFGKQEVLGAGLRSVIESAIAAELPVLIALCVAHKPSWDEFTGGEGEVVPPRLDDIVSWCQASCRLPA